MNKEEAVMEFGRLSEAIRKAADGAERERLYAERCRLVHVAISLIPESNFASCFRELSRCAKEAKEKKVKEV